MGIHQRREESLYVCGRRPRQKGVSCCINDDVSINKQSEREWREMHKKRIPTRDNAQCFTVRPSVSLPGSTPGTPLISLIIARCNSTAYNKRREGRREERREKKMCNMVIDDNVSRVGKMCHKGKSLSCYQ